jgi:hypothetical protein
LLPPRVPACGLQDSEAALFQNVPPWSFASSRRTNSINSIFKNEVPAWKGPGLSDNHCVELELRSTALTVTVLIVFVGLVLATLFRLVLASLAALLARLTALALVGLTRLTTLLALSVLIALLTFLLHIVRHKYTLLKKARNCAF